MPLAHGSSPAVVSSNISELRGSGYPQKQAIAIALSEKRRAQKHADGGAVSMLGNSFGNLVTPRGAGALSDGPFRSVEPIKPVAPGTLTAPDDMFAPMPDVNPMAMQLYGQEPGGGGGGMARGGRVGALRMEEGGDVDGGMGDAGSQGERDNTEGGDLSGALSGGYGLEGIDAPVDLGRAPPNTTAERGLIGLLGSMLGVPGLGLAATISEKLADWAEANGIATDRDPATGISAGGTQGALAGPQGALELGHFGPELPLQGGASLTDLGMQPSGALTAPGAALEPVQTALPALPALRQPIINPLTYGYGPAAGWLR